MKSTKILISIFLVLTVFSSCKKEEKDQGVINVTARVLNIGKIEGIKVSLNKTDNNQKLETKSTDMNGEVSFTEVAAGTYFLTASYEDGTDTYSGNTIDFTLKKNEIINQQIVLTKNN